MIGLFFSPKGRIGPAAFQFAAIILIGIGFVLNLAPFFSTSLTVIASLLSMVMLWPWIVIWVKRLHDAGKSGWMVLLVFAALLVINMVIGQVLTSMLVDQAAMNEAVANAGADIMAALEITTEFTKPVQIPSAISGAVIGFLIVLLGNKLLKSDPEENQYGPATSQAT